MKFKLLFLIFILVASNSFYAQNTDTGAENEDAIKELTNIYSNLEYNTIAFDDLKRKWIITDPIFIREIFNRFVVNNALRRNYRKVTVEEIKQLAEDIYEGRLLIDLRQRYYDDEVEFFAFMPEAEIDKKEPKLLFDPIVDPYYLNEILGNKLYERIKEQTYALNVLTKEDYDVKTGYFFDVNLNIMEPEIMFWSTTSNYRNKYLLSAFGKWGNDNIFVPGWNLPNYVFGFGLTFFQSLSNNPRNFTYKVKLGLGSPSGQVYKPVTATQKLFNSGQNIYFSITGDPLKYVWPELEDLEINLQGQFSMQEMDAATYGLKVATDFYTLRNYWNIEARWRNLFNLFDFGNFEAAAGIASHDINRFRYTPGQKKTVDLDPKKDSFDRFTHFGYVDVGVVRTGGLIQHSINFIFGHSAEGFGYYGLKTKVMLSDTFGFDVRFYSAYNSDLSKFPVWREESYIVFSPVLRINY
jgi:hypothetical protein